MIVAMVIYISSRYTYKYLCYLFENLPLAKTEDDLKALMPQSGCLEKQYRRSELEK